MIIDSLKNTEPYEHIHPLFKKAFDYLKSVDFAKTPIGKVKLDGDKLFVVVSDSGLKSKEDAKLEVHNEYIDIQLPISKSETFGWTCRANLEEEVAPFNTDKDIQFFKDKPDTYFTVEPGNFLIFFSGDGHAPCIGEGTIRKVVVKIKL